MRPTRLIGTVLGTLALAAVPALATPAASGAVAYPSSMAAAGDSITRAYDVNWLGFLRDNPAYSWSTGTVAGVSSEYSRLVALAPGISGHAYNDAKTGAKMVDLDGQLGTAASQGAKYVTILMGANDVCTSSISTMTANSVFASQFQQALNNLVHKDPGVEISVSSIPNIYQLWNVLHTNPSAVSTWRTFGICQSMLSSSNTEAQRQQVLAQENADNAALESVCGLTAGCRWDAYAANRVAFTQSDVSTVDYFHPSPSGQQKLAAAEWAAGYWGS